MPCIYLSPSTQEGNRYVTGGTEEYYMNLLADDKCAPEDRLVKVAALEQKIDDMTAQFRQNQLERMKESDHPDEMSVLYSEMLTDFERIGDHILNICRALAAPDPA